MWGDQQQKAKESKAQGQVKEVQIKVKVTQEKTAKKSISQSLP